MNATEYTREEIHERIQEAAWATGYCLAHCRHCSIGSHEHCLLKFKIERELERIYAADNRQFKSATYAA